MGYKYHSLTLTIKGILIFILFAGVTSDRSRIITRIDSLSLYTDIWDDYATVKHNCTEIIRLSDQIGRVDLKLVGLYSLCWSAENHGEMEDLEKYVGDGIKLLNENFNSLSSTDTGRMIMANMIHAAGQYYYNLGNYTRAIEEFLKIVPPGEKPLSQDSSILSAVYNYIGQSFFNSGSLDKSVSYFELASRYNQPGEDFNYSRALYLMFLAQYTNSIGQTYEAIGSLNQALPLLLKDTRKNYTRNALKSIYLLYASFFRSEAAYDSATYYVKRSMELYSPKDPEYINGYRLLGDIYYNSGKSDSALFCYTESLKLSNAIYSDIHFTKARSLCGIGNYYRDIGNYTLAVDYYNKSLQNLSSPLEGLKIKVEMAHLYDSWYNIQGKIALLDSGLQLLENALYLNDISRREQFNAESKESRSLLQSEIAGLGTGMASHAYEKTGESRYLEKTFHFMEKNKGNILLDKVYELNARNFAGIPQSVLEKEAQLRGEISYFRQRISSNNNSNDSTQINIRKKYEDKQLAYIQLVSEIEKNYNDYYKLKYEQGPATIKQLQHFIRSAHQMIIQYYIGKDKIYIAGITQKSVVLKQITRDEIFDNTLLGLLKQLSGNEIIETGNDPAYLTDFVKKSRFLYTHLIQPVLNGKDARIEEITIVPDGYLSYLPFEVLLTSDVESDKQTYGNLPYLIRKCRIRYENSASLILSAKRKTNRNKTRYIGFAPGYDSATAFSILPFNRDEVESCRIIWKGSSYSGNMATEKVFDGISDRYDLVHMATHTIINDDDPSSSCIVFAGANDTRGEGLLYINELYGMSINASLIILSGCETGIGKIKEGEGMISLARAFRYAGCGSILMSLWKINDKSSREIMVLFNKNLKKGLDKDKALQKAKLKYIEDSGNMHPAYWSSLVLIGDNNPLRGGLRLPGAAVFVLLMVLIFIAVKKIL